MSGRRGEVWFVGPDPLEVGSGVGKGRPCLIVQPPEMDGPRTTIVVPLTSKGFPAPFRVRTTFGSSSFAFCDRIRTVDRARLRRLAGTLRSAELAKILRTLQAIFTS